MAVVIRPRTEEDIPALAQVLVRVHARDGYPVEGIADPEAWLSCDHSLSAWVAASKSGVAGHCLLSAAGPTDGAASILIQEGLDPSRLSVVGRLFVLPGLRGKGLATSILATAATTSFTLGRTPTLDVLGKDQEAISLYVKSGWTKTGEFYHDTGSRWWPAAGYAMLENINGLEGVVA